MEIYKHNLEAYEKVKELFKTEKRCCVVHPTGTGKSFIALQLIRDNKDKHILYITSYSTNMLYFSEALKENVGIVPDIIFCLYAGLKPEELSGFDIIILDEFHRAGAPEWNKAVTTLLNENPDAKILGLSATPIRYLDKNRNMADELFGGCIASEITLHDALLNELLPLPSYTSCVYSFDEDIRKAEERLGTYHTDTDNRQAADILRKAKRLLENSTGLDEVFRQNINPCGKYLVFCSNYSHMMRMVAESHDWFSWLDMEPHRYILYSEDTDPRPYQAFLDDGSDCLRLLFCINMLNEGVHVKDIDGVILLRPTESPNVYFQQIGRALSVGTSGYPQIFDIVNNAAVLTPVRNFWNGVIHDFEADGKLFDGSFGIWAKDLEIISLLDELAAFSEKDHVWETIYGLCREYYKKHGELSVPQGFMADGVNLYSWLCRQRSLRRNHNPSLTDERITKLDEIGMNWNEDFEGNKSWDDRFLQAKEYYEKHGDLKVPRSYKCADGFSLGIWITVQRSRRKADQESRLFPLSADKIAKLDSIGMVWEAGKAKTNWDEAFLAAKEFYEEKRNLKIPPEYKCEDGFALGRWIRDQKRRKSSVRNPLTPEQIEKLDTIGIVWTPSNKTWEESFQYAENYYKEYGNLDTPFRYKSPDGFALGSWLHTQRARKIGKNKALEPLSPEQTKRLESIGMVWVKRTK